MKKENSSRSRNPVVVARFFLSRHLKFNGFDQLVNYVEASLHDLHQYVHYVFYFQILETVSLEGWTAGARRCNPLNWLYLPEITSLSVVG